VSEIQVSMTALRRNLSDLVNRAAYGGERIVLVSRGEPRAAIISIADLRQLEQLSSGQAIQYDQFTRALATADRLRERIQRWQEAHGIKPGDAVEDLRQLREGYDDDRLFNAVRDELDWVHLL
jgi:prevent-host-death family protein